MPEAATADRELIHRLNGQLLEALEKHLEIILGGEWKREEWIINVILLNRSTEAVYAARLETSATFYEGALFDRQDNLDPDRVGAFDLPVPLDRSFSGYCIQTGNVVWVDNIDEMNKFHPLYAYYRKFEFVAVQPQKRPKAEYVFPIFVRIGLIQSLLGVLNMEYFGERSPFEGRDSLEISEPIMKLLTSHGPFLRVASLDEASRIAIKKQSFVKKILGIHREVVQERTDIFKRDLKKLLQSSRSDKTILSKRTRRNEN